MSAPKILIHHLYERRLVLSVSTQEAMTLFENYGYKLLRRLTAFFLTHTPHLRFLEKIRKARYMFYRFPFPKLPIP
jgi:hypothetical protein